MPQGVGYPTQNNQNQISIVEFEKLKEKDAQKKRKRKALENRFKRDFSINEKF